MSQYFDYRIEAETKAETLCFDWCTKDPILAIADARNTIRCYKDDGSKVGDPVSRQCAAVALAWRPDSDMLVSGWQDGTIQVISLSNWQPREDQVVHSAPITLLKWNKTGDRLVSGDKNGVVGVWKPDGRGRLAPICQYNKAGAINHCIFTPSDRVGAVAAAAGAEYELCVCRPGAAVSHLLRLSTDSKSDKPAAQLTSFFFGGESGIVFYGDDMGNCTVIVESLHSPVAVMEGYEPQRMVVIITKNLQLLQLKIEDDLRLVCVMRVKLSMKADSGVQQAAWVGGGILATASADESLIRFWGLSNADNYTLSVTSHPAGVRNDRIISLAFCNRSSVLAAGTRDGKVLMWRHYSAIGVQSSAASWQAVQSVDVRAPVQALKWGPGSGLLGCLLYEDAAILQETILHRKLAGEIAVVQQSTTQVVVERIGGAVMQLTAGIVIAGMDIHGNALVLWSNKKCEVYEVQLSAVKLVSSFTIAAKSIAVYGEQLFVAVGNHVQMCNLTGTQTQSLAFTETEGAPKYLDVNGKHLVVTTAKSRIKVFDLSRIQPRQTAMGVFMSPTPSDEFGEISSVRINCDGTRVSLLCTKPLSSGVFVPESRVYVYSVDTDSVSYYDAGASRYPRSHFWDPTEPKLIAVEMYKLSNSSASSGGSATPAAGANAAGAGASAPADDGAAASASDVDVATLFATERNGVVLQHSFALDAEQPGGKKRKLEGLLGINIPKLFFLAVPEEADAADAKAIRSRIHAQPMRDFVGLDKVDETTRTALLDFSYNLAIGNMDEAYRAVKLIETPTVWENMAHMCIKSKRLDVAEVCLGNMGHARGARAVRESKVEPETDAAVAMVAIQLGMLQEAARLYEGCGRFDLLNKLYMASGKWEQALGIASAKDRIHLKTTQYLYARHLEANADFAGALAQYENADTHRYEVPRMLCDIHHYEDLESYVNAHTDKTLIRWWAQFCESKQQFEKAMKYYQKAGDVLALVRIYCYNDDFEAAAELVSESGDKAAAYHLARQHEAKGNVKEAISFFERAGRFNHAVRLAKDAGLDAELMNLTLLSSKDTMQSVARYFESKGVYDKAVQLYQKGGNVARALELCFRANLFDDLRAMADDLGEGTPPEVLARCSDFFLSHGQFEKAAHLLLVAGKVEQALDLVVNHKIPITEDMAEKMTPPKDDSEDPAVKARRTELLTKLANAAFKQGAFHLAAKKYTQAGDKVKAMKALIKSQDTEKIMFFAGVSRLREVYILAANHLQTLDWHSDTNIMKAIVSYYTKARAMDSLAGFYDACAQVEIDEYRNYSKALGALQEAMNFMSKARSTDRDRAVESLRQRISLVEQFVQARSMVSSNPAEMVRICNGLLEQRDIESAIRIGDVYALLIEFYYAKRNIEQAYRLIENMRTRNIAMGPYLDAQMVNNIYREMGVQPAEEEAEEGGVGEEIEESVED